MAFYGLHNPIQINLRNKKVQQPKNLVFSGGGIKGLAYAGAIKALEELGKNQDILRYAGASAGAITAALLAIGLKSKELHQELCHIQFSNLLEESKVNIQSLLKHPKTLLLPNVGIPFLWDEIVHRGLCDGTYFTEWLVSLFEKQGFNENTTFEEMNKETGKELHVTLCNLNLRKTIIANYKETPSMPVALAVRGSMSIPLVYWPFEWEGDIYVDGGTTYNYPIELFDVTGKQDQTLGFLLEPRSRIFDPKRRPDTNFAEHLALLYDAIMDVDYEYCFRMGNEERTVFIDTKDIGTFDFNLNIEQKETLFEEGYKATKAYYLV